MNLCTKYIPYFSALFLLVGGLAGAPLTESSLSPLLLKGHTARYQNAINSRG